MGLFFRRPSRNYSATSIIWMINSSRIRLLLNCQSIFGTEIEKVEQTQISLANNEPRGFKMRTLVIYKSTSGFTKKYAEWIAEELKADILSAKDFDAASSESYDLIVFGGCLHAVGISGLKCITENLGKLSEKEIIVFAVGASPPTEKVLEEVRDNNFSDRSAEENCVLLSSRRLQLQQTRFPQ